VNSNFENQRGWTLRNAAYDDDLAHKGTRSMRTGILNRGNDQNQTSYAWQSVTIPRDIDHAMLRMWVYTQVDGVAPAGARVQAESAPAGYRPGMGLPFTPENQPESLVANDTQYVLIYEPGTFEVLDTVMWAQYDNKRAWEFVEFNLAKYRGETILIYFGTDNVNNGVATAMFVDEVVVELCDLDTGTPTASPKRYPHRDRHRDRRPGLQYRRHREQRLRAGHRLADPDHRVLCRLHHREGAPGGLVDAGWHPLHQPEPLQLLGLLPGGARPG
jgi:hypothetical protein